MTLAKLAPHEPSFHFVMEYEYWTRPLYRKGRAKRDERTCVAHDLAEALRIAKEFGELHFRRRKWKLLSCKQAIYG